MNRCKTRFTLVEVVAAMMVLMVVGMILAAAGSAFYNSYRRTAKTTAKLEEYMAIDRVFDSGMANLLPFKWKDDDNESRFVFEGLSDSLLFCSRRRSYGNDAGLIFIRLKLDDDKLVAEYSSTPILPWEEERATAEIRRETLAAGVNSLSFRYAELSDGELEWYDTWEEDEHAALPLAVRMTVEWRGGTREYWLRRTGGNSRDSTFGYRETEVDESVGNDNFDRSSGGGR